MADLELDIKTPGPLLPCSSSKVSYKRRSAGEIDWHRRNTESENIIKEKDSNNTIHKSDKTVSEEEVRRTENKG